MPGLRLQGYPGNNGGVAPGDSSEVEVIMLEAHSPLSVNQQGGSADSSQLPHCWLRMLASESAMRPAFRDTACPLKTSKSSHFTSELLSWSAYGLSQCRGLLQEPQVEGFRK